MRPNDSSARPVAVDQPRADDGDVGLRGRARRAGGRSRRRARSVSLFSSRMFAPRAGADADVVGAREAEVGAGLDHRARPAIGARRPRCRRSTRCRRRRSRAARPAARACSDSRQRSRSARALNETMMIESVIGQGPASTGPRAGSDAFEDGQRLARRARPAVPRQHRRRGREDPRPRRPRRTAPLRARASSRPGRRPARRAPRRRSSRARPACRAGRAARRPPALRAASARALRTRTGTQRRAPRRTASPSCSSVTYSCQRTCASSRSPAIVRRRSSRG